MEDSIFEVSCAVQWGNGGTMEGVEVYQPGGQRGVKIAYGSFYLAVMIEVLMVIVDKSAYTNPIEGRLFQLTFLLCLIKVVLTRYSWKEYGIIGIGRHFLFCNRKKRYCQDCHVSCRMQGH